VFVRIATGLEWLAHGFNPTRTPVESFIKRSNVARAVAVDTLPMMPILVEMSISKANLDLVQGDDYVATVTVTNANGTPADISGYTAKAQIRQDVADEARRVDVEIATAVASPNVTLTIPHAITQTLTAASYVWDLQLTSAGGQITTILAGTVVVTREVTRAAV
jgi:hypothetical protein